jgi:hypothetical protein
MIKDPRCHAYWFTFPGQPHAPMGMGVTARSLEDAYSLLEERGYTFHRSGPVEVREHVTADDLRSEYVLRNMGPMVFRGIWYPCLNIGHGASGTSDPEGGA